MDEDKLYEEIMESIDNDELLKQKTSAEKIKTQYDKYKEKAKRTLDNDAKMEEFFQKLERKLVKFPVAGNTLSEIPVLASMVRAYVKREYTKIPAGTVVAALAGLLYFVAPIDLIPDTVFFAGLFDDAAMITFVLRLIEDDLRDYMSWQLDKGIREE